jgi:hypothetical protein
MALRPESCCAPTSPARTTSTTGYEINYHHAGSYCEIVKWNGALGSFVYLAQLTVGLSA